MDSTLTLTLNNGVEMPRLGLGVYQSPPEETVSAVEIALTTGYRLIDTAACYFNEREVGEGLRRSGVDRSDVFLETKIWVTDYGREATLHGFEKSAAKLGVEQIDLLLLHQPQFEFFDRTIGAYLALEELLAQGKVRAIGVSNFMPTHMADLMEHASVVPAVNQVELHPYFIQADVQADDRGRGIVTQAWSPIGGITHYWGDNGADGVRNPLEEPALAEIAATHGKTPAQVMLRWHLDRGRGAIPKSVRAERIAENVDLFDFELDDAELTTIDTMDRGIRGGPSPYEPQPARFEITIEEA